MLQVVSKNNIKVKTNALNGTKEISKAVDLANSGKMQRKPLIIIGNEVIGNELKSGIKMV